MHRVGIIPFDIKEKLTALLFVTSISRGRWILPKGLAKPNESHADTCCREGFEEAGVRGVVLDDFPVTVLITKSADNGVQKIPVTYYPFLVQKQEDEWPESERRERHWTLIEDAAKVAYKDDFVGLIEHFNALEPWIREAAVDHKS
ncbi:MAG: NUDIX domain-containing protein [Pseudomonadota bacterium]